MQHEKIEAIVLGAILMEKGAYHVVSGILQPDYFTGWHEEVYTAIVEVNADGKPIDLTNGMRQTKGKT